MGVLVNPDLTVKKAGGVIIQLLPGADNSTIDKLEENIKHIRPVTTMMDEGKSIKDTIIEGSTDRLNPIIMTALTSMLALIPLAIGGELPGNEIQSPMAKVILGGLLSSTLLNMFVVPIVYMIIEKRRKSL